MEEKKNPPSSSSSSPPKTHLKTPTPSPLPSDILLEIFSNLPIKSLLRFLSVSKSWHSFISSNPLLLPSPVAGLFSHFFISFSPLPCSTYTNLSTIDTSLSFLPPFLNTHHNPLHTIHCSNGLLLLKDSAVYHPLYLIANPATRRWSSLPPPPSPDPLDLVLAFDPHRGDARHFKILSFPRDSEFSEHWVGDRLEVYSSNKSPPEWSLVKFVSGVGGNGVRFDQMRFAVLDEVVFVLDVEGNCYGVDVEGKMWWKVNVGGGVEVCPMRVGMHCIGVCTGVLHRGLVVGGELVVWALESLESKEFVLKWRRRVFDLVEKLYGGEGWEDGLGIVAFHPDLEVVLLRFKGKLLSYHWTKCQLEEICEFDKYRQWFVYSPCYSDDLDL